MIVRCLYSIRCFYRRYLNKTIMSDPVVEVEQGKLKGTVCKAINNKPFYKFKSIPYAKPPIGELRFSIPEPPEPWEGIRDASKDCHICPQFDRLTNSVVGDEDCLYLNVYTPQLPCTRSSLLPVMVFIHGGGFVFGNGTDDLAHGPDFLMEKNVVLVSFNYRLGILGFLSLNCKEAPGNMGLRDQVEALKWVQKNIIKFGGDPNNVTIFGFSAGAASVEYLLISPMAKGLFHKAIAQSGSSLLAWAQNNKLKELAATIPALNGKTISDDKQLLKYFKGLPIKDLIASSMAALSADEFRGGIHFGFVPIVEKPRDWEPFLDKSTYDALSQGKFTKVPFMTGFCSREGLLMVSLGVRILEKLVEEKNFTKHLPFKVDAIHEAELETRLKAMYLDAENKHHEDDYLGIDFFSDVDFVAGIHVAASLIAKHNSPVYYYEFSYDGSQNYLKKKWNITRKGACHGDDGGYIIKSSILPDELSETDKLVRDRILEMWTNFARHGNPTPTTNSLIDTKWEPIAETRLASLQIGDKLSMKYDVYPDRMKLFQELYKNYYNKTNGFSK